MTADGIAILQVIFNLIWRLFTSWHIPGTVVTPAGFFLFLVVSALFIRVVKNLLSPHTSEVENVTKKDK